MPLQRHHILAMRLNWSPKSQNLKELAAELGLGLDSFIFIDDSPLECAEVEAHCPEVLTLQLPPAAEKIPQLLRHVWALDRRKSTAEDTRRTALYRANLERESSRREAMSLGEFLAGLELVVTIAAAAPHQLDRVAQLTQRTNQLNLSTVRRSAAEIALLCESGARECLAVEVRDRFGDYGLVGAILFVAGAKAIEVDTFLLSCRALGRGVEHRMLAFLGELARARGKAGVEVPFVPTDKNRPAREFLESVGADCRQPAATGSVYRFPADRAIALTAVALAATE
jgi:FkbH-like protein